MHRLRLPEPPDATSPAFTDPATAQTWLAGIAAKPAQDALAAILEQIEAIDGGTLPPPQAIALLNLLRSAVIPRQAITEGLFTRKALPMLAHEEHSFTIAQQLWTRLGIAYLRLVPQCTPANRCLPLHRAASALRLAEYCHFLAARTCPPLLDQLLFSVLASAEVNGVLRKQLADPDFPQYGKGSVAGQLAWAFLLRTIDPYHLAAPQLQVVNRAFSRWRELVSFEATPGDTKGHYILDLSLLFGGQLPAPIPRYLLIRVVAHKLAQRIQALQAGESPEALKLGRTLSANAAIRLLKDVEHHLHPRPAAAAREQGTLELVFGGDNAYALLNNKTLNSIDTQGAADRSLAYQRMALFGFEPIRQTPTEVTKKLSLPSEHWTLADGMATRSAGAGDSRLLAPCLIAAEVDGVPRLGIMSSLQSNSDGILAARLTWHREAVEAGMLKRLAPRGNKLVRVPAFLLHEHEAWSLIVPADAGARLGVAIDLTDTSIDRLIPAEIAERGTDFVHYACRLPA